MQGLSFVTLWTRGHEIPKPLRAFAREKVKEGSQQDSHLTEGSKASSGIETRRNSKWRGCKELRRREAEASRKLIKKEKMAIKIGKDGMPRKKGRRKEEEKWKRSRETARTVNIYKYSGQQCGKNCYVRLWSICLNNGILFDKLRQHDQFCAFSVLSKKKAKVFNECVFCKM